MWTEIIVCIIAGIGAGVGTGLAGLSAAVVIAPMLITFLHFDAYEAVGIALASDVLASAVSALVYARNKNIDIKNGLVMLLSVVVFTFVGSFAASYVSNSALGGFSVVLTAALGLRFLVFPVMAPKPGSLDKTRSRKAVESLIAGVAVGFVCGFVGAGGGMMMLMVLTGILGYDLKKAVGTSVMIMSFTALTGAVSHAALGGMPDPLALGICIAATLLASIVSSAFANRASPKVLNRVTGGVLCGLGIAMIIVKFAFPV